MADAFPASFYAALSQAGIAYSGPVLTDDKIHRFKCAGDHDANSWYVLRVKGGIVFGGFGDWKRQVSESYCSERELTPAQRTQQRDAWQAALSADKAERDERAAKARALLADGFKVWPKVDSHPYLTKKGIKPVGDIRLCQLESYKNWLVVPMFDEKGVLQSAEYIADDGTKRSQFGGIVQGCFFTLAERESGPVILAEGYSTGVSVFQATNWQTHVARNCGNLLSVARILRKKYPDRLLIVAGDDDHIQSCDACKKEVDVDSNPELCPNCRAPHLKINSGVVKGREAAKSVVGIFVTPKFSDSAEGKPTDFNDLANISGAAAVRQQILSAIPNALKPASITLVERKFDFSRKPPEVRPVFKLKDTVIATPGNLVTITSQVKTGKSAMVGAMEASTMVAIDSDADTLGFYSRNLDNKLVLHFDSEQSPDDHWFCSMRTLRRAGVVMPPTWFRSYCLTGLGHKRAWECVLEAVKDGPVHSIFLDGTADFVADVNDAAESNEFVSRLHDLAIQIDCPIIGVIHFNPGGEKSRGHLGSQLERKAESNLRLDKDSETTVIWSEKQRGAPILKANGPAFKWSDERQMHVSCVSGGDLKGNLEREHLQHVVEEVFGNRSGIKYSDLIAGFILVLKKSESTSKRDLAKALRLGIVVKSVAGLYAKGTYAK
jgi:phage/plasmid primase-like uncharacterized protein